MFGIWIILICSITEFLVLGLKLLAPSPSPLPQNVGYVVPQRYIKCLGRFKFRIYCVASLIIIE